MFNISEIVQSQVPDNQGNIIPATTQEGSAELTGPLGEAQHILVSIDAGIYNAQKALCSTGYCITCQGAEDEWVDADPFTVAVGGTTQQTFTVEYHNGIDYNVTSTATWSSSNASMGTVTAGLVTGVGVGSFELSASSDEPIYSYACYQANPDSHCPGATFVGGSAPGSSGPTVTFSGTPVVPVNKTATITATVSPSTNTIPITLTLATTSGSGLALFVGGGSTTTITTSSPLTILGAQASSTPNNISLTATAGSQNSVIGSTTLTVGVTNGGALPVNFMQTGVTTASGPALVFTYTWQSSSGSLSDISQCTVREFVTYPGYVQGQQLNYYWTSPPYYDTFSPNPTTGNPGSAAGAGLSDSQGNVGFVKPYTANTVTSNQVYQYQCPYYSNDQWIQFFPQAGTIPITRVVQEVGSAWEYTITKSGSSATGVLP